jgi:midasin
MPRKPPSDLFLSTPANSFSHAETPSAGAHVGGIWGDQVGETGTGKTALIQYLARLVGAELTVLNLSNQSDSTDFIGGYKPVDEGRLCAALVPSFQALFYKTFPQQNNTEYVGRVLRYAERRKWKQLLQACRLACGQYTKLADEADQREHASRRDHHAAGQATSDKPRKKQPSGGGDADDAGQPQAKKSSDSDKGVEVSAKKSKRARVAAQSLLALRGEWAAFDASVAEAEAALLRAGAGGGGALAFAFVEGAVLNALQVSAWRLASQPSLRWVRAKVHPALRTQARARDSVFPSVSLL